MQKRLAVLLVTLVGCGSGATPAIPPTAGDFVKNSNGVGTAQVLGITFRVNVKSNGASTEDSIDANFIDVDQSKAQKRFTFGDEITIQLDSIDESKTTFKFNDQGFGNLNVGDEVVIDDARNVAVNGTSRLPTESTMEEQQ